MPAFYCYEAIDWAVYSISVMPLISVLTMRDEAIAEDLVINSKSVVDNRLPTS